MGTFTLTIWSTLYGLKSSIMDCVPIFHYCVDWNFTQLFTPNKSQVWMDRHLDHELRIPFRLHLQTRTYRRCRCSRTPVEEGHLGGASFHPQIEPFQTGVELDERWMRVRHNFISCQKIQLQKLLVTRRVTLLVSSCSFCWIFGGIFPHEIEKIILREVRFDQRMVRLNNGKLQTSRSE